MDNSAEFRCISLCTGYAGLELGIKRAVPNLRTVCYVEIEAFACANLVAKIEAGLLDTAPIWTDLKTFDGQPFYKRVHLITAGYPCQGESVAGKRQGKADPRWLWPHIERIIQAVRPLYCFFENVSGHLSIGFPEVYRSLRNLGYKVEAGLFTAEEVGAPHKRERLFVLAHSQSVGHRGGFSTSQSNENRISESESVRQQIERSSCRGNKLANSTSSQRYQGKSANFRTQRTNQKSSNSLSKSSNRWPSRPGRPQYEWEEPRVVADTGKKQTERLSQSEGWQQNREAGITGRQRQAQSRLGRAANGTSCRVDRLRLLGNGVVPRQAELAFRVLIESIR